MLAAIRTLNRLELVGETLRAALNVIAAVAPDWLRGIAPPDAAALPAVAVLRRVWGRHFERVRAGSDGSAGSRVQLRGVQGRGPGDRIESPYDIDARFRAKSGASWTGYMAHITETCDAEAPRLVVHADTTPANVHGAMRTEPIHMGIIYFLPSVSSAINLSGRRSWTARGACQSVGHLKST